MDLSSFSGAFGGIADELLQGAAAKIAGSVGMSPAQIQPLVEKARVLAANSPMTPEIEAKIAQLATEHGVPPQMVDTAVSLIKAHIAEAPAK